MIYLPPPQPVAEKDIRIHGDVEVHPTASLAPGTILQAELNSRIVIGANVCIGMGTIINAVEGSVEIENGVTLGAGVLIIGASKIGNNACIGTSTTIFKASVSAMKVVKPGSIIGDPSRKVDNLQEDQAPPTEKQDTENFQDNHSFHKNSANNHKVSKNNNNPTDKTSNNLESKSSETSNGNNSSGFQNSQLKTTRNKGEPVVGQVYINELLVTLFPHRKIENFHSVNGKEKEEKI